MPLRVHALTGRARLSGEAGQGAGCGRALWAHECTQGAPTPDPVWCTLINICGVNFPEQPCHALAMHGCLAARVHHHLQPATSQLIVVPVRKVLWAPAQVNLENAPEAGLIGEALLFPRCACAPKPRVYE